MKRTRPVAIEYPAGYFTALMRLHNWPPGFTSQLGGDPGEVKRREAAVRGRATQLANGHTGSMKNGLSKKSVGTKPDLSKTQITQMGITRDEAAKLGLKRYYTGEPCIEHHRAERYVSTAGCCECVKLHSRTQAVRKRAVPV